MVYGLALSVSLCCLAQSPPDNDVFREGKISVRRQMSADPKWFGPPLRHVLFINDTNFGVTILSEGDNDLWRRKPTTYYHLNGPVGFLFRSIDPILNPAFQTDAVPPARLIAASATGPLFTLALPWSEPAIGVVGMHSGTIASYAKPLRAIHFYERNPIIVKLSLPAGNEQPLFRNIVDAQKRGAQVKVVAGDVRASMERAPKGYFKFLFVEICQRIYLEDIEVELITKEGVKACVDSLTHDGIACFHTSNRYVDVQKLVRGAAKDLKLASCRVYDQGGRGPGGNGDNDHFISEWVFISRDESVLKQLRNSPLRGRLIWDATLLSDDFWTDQGAKPLKGILRTNPIPGRVAMALFGPLYKMLPATWSRQIQQWVGGLTEFWNQRSLARMERDNVMVDWLRKTR